MKTIFNTLYYVTIGAVGLVGLMIVSSLIPIPGNFEIKVVKSGSMEPAVHVGGVVIIKPSNEYKIGDVITFGADTKTQIPTTHRIVAMEGEGANVTYQTKGDANNAPDPVIIKKSDIHGKMLLTVPYLGYLLVFARTKLGFMILVGIPALMIFFEEGKNIFIELRRMRRKNRVAKTAKQPEEPMLSVPIKPQHALVRDEITRASRSPAMRVMGVLLAVGAIASLGAGVGTYGDTVAYYADQAASIGNVLGAGIFNIDTEPLPEVTLSAAALLSIDETREGSTTPVTPPDDPPEVTLGDPVVQSVEVPPDPPPSSDTQ
jgi:signal peptidase